MSILIFRRRHHTVPPFLAFTTQPGGANSGSAFSPQPVVTAKNPDGTTKTSFTGNVTLAVNTTTGSHALGGTTTVAAVAGVATFTNVTDTGSGNGTLTATATGYSSATSASFTTAAGGPTTVVSDTFTRADNASSLGSTESGTAGVLAWTAQRGQWGISGNKAYLAVASSSAIATVSSGVSDCTVSLTYSTVSFGNAGIVFRYTDLSNHWALQCDGSNVVVTKTAGAAVVLNVAQAVVSGDVLSVVMSGNTIVVKLNGVQVGSTITDATDQTATKHGMKIDNWTGDRLDNFTVTVP